jgi:hypothetical protein
MPYEFIFQNFIIENFTLLSTPHPAFSQKHKKTQSAYLEPNSQSLQKPVEGSIHGASLQNYIKFLFIEGV